MARLPGVSNKEAGWFVRFAYYMTKRELGRVVTPIRIHAYHPRLLRARAYMELGEKSAKTVDGRVKALVELKVARLVGCPF